MDSKAQAQADKQEARKARNEAQAVIERDIWQDVEAQASQAVTAARSKQGVSYTQELGQEVIIRLSEGQSLASICRLDYMPHIATVYDWIKIHPSFADGYARARENAAHTLFDQMLDIADDSSGDLLADGSANNAAIARARLQIDTRARVAGKLHSKAYGERVDALAGTVTINNNTLQIDSRTLDADQRNNLRAMLLQARDSKLIEQ